MDSGLISANVDGVQDAAPLGVVALLYTSTRGRAGGARWTPCPQERAHNYIYNRTVMRQPQRLTRFNDTPPQFAVVSRLPPLPHPRYPTAPPPPTHVSRVKVPDIVAAAIPPQPTPSTHQLKPTNLHNTPHHQISIAVESYQPSWSPRHQRIVRAACPMSK